MSQRLYIGSTTVENVYDCILTDETDARQKLLDDWFVYRGGVFSGPWKIRIGDIGLFRKLEPIIADLFSGLGKEYPDDVWFFYLGDSSIEHPTVEELTAWLNELEKK